MLRENVDRIFYRKRDLTAATVTERCPCRAADGAMARQEHARENLMAEATALVERVELLLTGVAEPIVAGFRLGRFGEPVLRRRSGLPV